MNENKMNGAYRIAHELVRDRLSERTPEILEELDQITEADVIIVRGCYDHIETVLEQAGTPFTLVNADQIDHLDLRPDQIVFVNCPGKFSSRGIKKLMSFVESGGFLFTTDWALKNVLERAFPGMAAYNLIATRDEVVRIEVLDMEDPFLASLLDSKDDPLWWLEGSSYPIRIVDKDRVKVLVKSREIEQRYGENPVFIRFDYGEGRVYHMISHFYLQRSETRTKRHKLSSSIFMKEKGVSAEKMGKYKDLGAEQIPLADVESAYTSYGMTHHVLIEKMRREREKARKQKEGEYHEHSKEKS